VVQKGKGDGCYINTSGVGVIDRPVNLSAASCRPGDAVIVSGPIGEHGITIMLARGELEIEADIASDTAPLAALMERTMRHRRRGACVTRPEEASRPSSTRSRQLRESQL
jgi:hydrogenase expression/formation protein HypE